MSLCPEKGVACDIKGYLNIILESGNIYTNLIKEKGALIEKTD